MDTTRISVLWSISPCGNVALTTYFTEIYVSQMISAFPGLRDMVNQIPRYHIHNLIDQIRQTQNSGVEKPSNSPKEKEVCETQESEAIPPSIHYPFISNTIQHLSQSSDKVFHSFKAVFTRRFDAGAKLTPLFGRFVVKPT